MKRRKSIILAAIVSITTVDFASSTAEQCHIDCHSISRPVGPTRPWDQADALGNSLHLTRPYPHHVAAIDDRSGKYPFAEFCSLGCNYFFVSSGAGEEDSDIKTLDQCISQCDENFSYNITVYNDLIEIARLECRDGCQMALKRCQPGYYCLQVSFHNVTDPISNILHKHYEGGEMIPCPAGTYRETSYDAITKCIQCPPNSYREEIKGKSSSDCSKCPPYTSSKSGSASVRDCVRVEPIDLFRGTGG